MTNTYGEQLAAGDLRLCLHIQSHGNGQQGRQPLCRVEAQQLTAHEEFESAPPNEHDFVHGVVASIAVLKARTMRTLWACSDVADLLTSIHNLQGQLREWYERLPLTVQLSQMGTDVHIPLKTSIYYVHLLHLGAVMLMFRHGLAGLQASKDRTALSVEQRILLDKTLDDGIMAAQQSVRMVHLLRESSRSVRHCWVTMCD